MVDYRTAPYAALVLRVSLGATFVAHSLVLKYFVFTLPGTAQFFQSLGLPAALAYEYPLFLIAASLALALLGDGKYALSKVRAPSAGARTLHGSTI